MNEEWRDVLNYEGYYQVSSLGSVRSLGGRKGSSKRFLKYADTKGYDSVALSLNNHRKTFQVHRLVLDAFGGHKSDMEINHKDGNKKNNQLSNLEWVTHQGNMEHASSMGLVNNRGSKHGMHKLTEFDVEYIRQPSNESNHHLAARFGVSESTISDIKLGKTWKHIALHEAGELK